MNMQDMIKVDIQVQYLLYIEQAIVMDDWTRETIYIGTLTVGH